MVALPFARHSTMVLLCCGGLGFVHEHSQLRSSSLLSPQAVSLQPTLVSPRVCSPNPTFHHPAPTCIPESPYRLQIWKTMG